MTAEEESFAHMVESDKQSSRPRWVEVVLPKTVRRLKERAFVLEEPRIGGVYDSEAPGHLRSW